MKIGISGTQGTGKSYTLYELANKYKLKYPNKEVTVITEVARTSPYEINENAPIQSQIWMISTQIKKELEAEKSSNIIITDRTLCDYMAYTKFQYPDLFYTWFPFLKYYISTYDIIYFKDCYKNNYLVDDGTRAMNKAFRKKIDEILLSLYNQLMPDIKNFEVI